MEIKGSAVDSVRKFVLSEFKESGQERWHAALPEASRRIFDGLVLPSAWYPAHDALIVPTQLVCDLFYDGDIRAAWKLGRFSADQALHGLYRALVRFASPSVLVERSAHLLNTYYRPMKIDLKEVRETCYVLTISEVDEPSPIIDYRIAGWSERGFEICRANEVKVAVVASARDAHSVTQIQVEWS